MTSPKRRARLFEFTRDEIVAAARRSFRLVGLEGATMREIASEAGFAVGALYRYFPSKTALVNAAADEVVLEMIRALEGDCPADEDFRAYFRGRFTALFEVFLADRMLIHAFGRARASAGDGEIGVSPEVSKKGMGAVEGLVAEGVRRGLFQAPDTHLAAYLVQGAFRSAFFLYAERPESERPQVVDQFLQFVFEGLGVAPGQVHGG